MESAQLEVLNTSRILHVFCRSAEQIEYLSMEIFGNVDRDFFVVRWL